ncbi:hypothetical protein GQ53DRAFT_845243 [Thozetella sp. PMI_491]|nr:hypothetical protein GQ53DRAFT_845243 [Thozetella sp. PMI_491]
MARGLKRTHTAQAEVLQLHNGARTSTWLLPQDGRSVLEVQVIRNAAEWKDIPNDKNPLIPPYHWHWKQDEYFDIKKGRFIFTIEGKEVTRDETSPTVVVPATARHTWRVDASYDGPCEIHISASPSQGLDEKFFRNIYNYLDDCEKQNLKPSLPQMLLFIDAAEFSLAFPGPAPLMRLLSRALGLVVGRWYGGWWLGLKDSYDEYFDINMVKTI